MGMGLREEHFWLKRIITSDRNRPHHRPALLRLIELYERKWMSNQDVNRVLVSMSVKDLRSCLKQD
jgi:hypothetical protein